MIQRHWSRRRFLAACGLAPFALAGCGGSAREKVSRDLYEIGQAFHNFQAATNYLPRAGTPRSAKGGTGRGLKEMHWRVALLSYLEEDGLFKEIESGTFGDNYWESDELAGRCPKRYAAGTGAEANMTRYLAFVSEGILRTPLQANHNTRLQSIADGTNVTLLVVEAEEPVPWASRQDLAYDRKKPLPKLGHPSRDGFFGLIADGTVWYFPKNTDEKQIRAMITADGVEILDAVPGTQIDVKQLKNK
jgi:Protein of unknown function (DUF1559)